MRILCVAYEGVSFYAAWEGETVRCLDTALGYNTPLQLQDVSIEPLVSPGKIICLGLNYKCHAKELGWDLPEEPMIFFKPPSALTAHNAPVYLPAASQHVDYEGELAVVIAKKGRNILPDTALEYVLGYTCANDITARDLQQKDSQFTRAKGFDTFLPLGPWIETEPGDIENLPLTTFVNGKIRQQGNTGEMIFSIPQAIGYISSIMTLMPGDVILTGTPKGIGKLHPGDEVTVTIQGIGSLQNTVKAE